jgi:hypothetical protein
MYDLKLEAHQKAKRTVGPGQAVVQITENTKKPTGKIPYS